MTTRLAGVAFVASSALTLTADVDWLLRIVPDDTFYYLQIARQLAGHGISTFDGTSVTNGYHPLWMLLLTGLATVVDDRITLLRSAMVLALTLHVASAVAIHSAIRRLVDAEWARVAAACWLINPLGMLLAVQATEASLYAAAATSLFALHLRLLEPRLSGQPPPWAMVVGYGVALGLLCLARTDGLVVTGIALAWLGWPALVQPGRRGTAAARAVVAALAVALVIAPWWIFSYITTGTIIQDSGAMKALWAADLHPDLTGRLANLAATLGFFTRRTLSLMTVWNFSGAGFGCAVLILCVATATVCLRSPASLAARAVASLLLPFGALTVTYGLGLVDRQVWWLAFPCVTMLLVSFITVPLMIRLFPGAARVGAVVKGACVIVAVLLIGRWHVKDRALYPWQPDVRRSQIAIEALVPAPTPIGVFNAGIPAYFGAGRVVALDGLVNHDARVHWTERRFDEFLTTRGIVYIADEGRALDRAQRFARQPLPLERVAAFPLAGWPTEERILWRVRLPALGKRTEF